MTRLTNYAPGSDILHVIPVDDLIEHPLTADCKCTPVCEPVPHDDGAVGWLYVHNSADGRERSEKMKGNKK